VSSGGKLTTTSYALLGLLAIKSWTSYELTQQMQRSLRRFWPRAESKLYEEPKKLAAQGLVTGAVQTVGRRRTVYTITDDGRRELGRWLSRPGEGPVLESEQLLKVFFAEHGTKQDLLATLADVRAWGEQRAAEDAAIARGYLAGQGPFQARAAQLALVGRYSADLAEMNRRWAEWATAVVEQWPEELPAAAPDTGALREIAARWSPPSP
jgi:PadR family transcriptional regulator, regulatory protein AphA